MFSLSVVFFLFSYHIITPRYRPHFDVRKEDKKFQLALTLIYQAVALVLEFLQKNVYNIPWKKYN